MCTILDPLCIGRVCGGDASPKTRSLRVDWSVWYISIISVLAGDKGVNSYSSPGVAVRVRVFVDGINFFRFGGLDFYKSEYVENAVFGKCDGCGLGLEEMCSSFQIIVQ